VQLAVQLVAVVVAGGYAFAVTTLLVRVIDGALGFGLAPQAEAEGLDRAVHGEVGFDLGPPVEPVPEPPREPRPATEPPPTGFKRRFTVVVEGAPSGELLHAWAGLCQAGERPPTVEFRAVYPYLTTVAANRFHFRGGDPAELRQALQRLLEDQIEGASIHTYVED
jgi:hypothetical protein